MKRVLVAVLDWGLGHATRCVPIIEELIRAGVEPVLASSGRAGVLLGRAFPALIREELPPYAVSYRSENMYWNMARQGPGLIRTIRKEYQEIQKLVDRYQPAAIISDNRYGCFSPKVPSIIITHQVNIYFPRALVSRMVNRVNHRLIRNFDECWIPDLPAAPGLAGLLSHPAPFPQVSYLGILSRLHPADEKMKYDLLVLLSGPEPQRTRVEELLWSQIRHRQERVLFVLGKPEESERREEGNISVAGHLEAADLSRALASSRQVICRSGYSTLMDLAHLGKKAILIPTPGQTEQEYLARRLTAAGICYHEEQSRFEVGRAIERSAAFRGFAQDQFGEERLEKIIAAFLKKI